MKSKGSSASSSAVLDTPEESFAATDWRGRGPAPAGALQRGRFADDDAHAAPEERPYVPRRESLRYRLMGVPRTMGGRILAGSVVLGVLTVLIGGIAGVQYYLLHNDRYVVTTSSDIQISGNQHLTRAQVLSVFGADLERNIFRVPLAERKADLERLPWVAHATVMRLLPNQLRIAVTERVPVAFVRQGAQIGLVDGSGVLLDMPQDAAGDPQYSFPVLTGLVASDELPKRAARMDVYHKFIAELDSGGQKLTQNLSEVDVSNPEDVKALIADNGSDVLVHFGDEQFLDRYREFMKHLPEWKQSYPKLQSADMRYDGQIVLETGKDVVPTAPVEVADATTAAASLSQKPAPKPVAKKPVPNAKTMSAKLAAARAGRAQ